MTGRQLGKQGVLFHGVARVEDKRQRWCELGLDENGHVGVLGVNTQRGTREHSAAAEKRRPNFLQGALDGFGIVSANIHDRVV